MFCNVGWRLALLFACVGVAFEPRSVYAEVKVPAAISKGMVLQRDMLVPIWGTAEPGEKVAVKFRDQEKSTIADENGKWAVKLDRLKAGGPDTLTVTGKNTLKLDDVLVGEVWVGSGQSNMQGTVNSYMKSDPVLAKLANESYPKIRLITAGRGGWQESNAKSNQSFSALMFAFGVRLNQELDVPVGLMVGAVGGTPSGYWLSDEMLAKDDACQQVIKKAGATVSFEEQKAKYDAALTLWEKAVEQAKKDDKPAPKKPQAPAKAGQVQGKVGHLYEAHIKPFQPFAIRGVVWDQGESGTAVSGLDQYTLMGALIRGWRLAWGQGEFPFIFIQKPSGGGCAWNYDDPIMTAADKFAKLPASVPPASAGFYRDNHIRIKNYPNTAMAITSDLGPGIHPINKSGYGTRASQVALGMVYGRKGEYYGPVYQSHKSEGNKIRITFDHAGQGLAFKNGEALQGFAIAGADKNFVWADAVIDGNAVVLSSLKVTEPVAVRYAWSQTHPWANLFNRDGLPALPFRTDSWEK
ncbi:MAG: sialate O-acetylesterase [Planctomycetota bacterium]